MSGRPYRWEKSYPPGLDWGTPIATSTLPELLDRAVASFAERPAIDFRDRKVSYRRLGETSARAAAGLAGLGIGPRAAVALYLPNVPWHPVALFGAARAGARVVQLSPLDAERELAHKLGDSGARTLITVDTSPLLPTALKLKAAGHVDRVIVGDDAAFGEGPAAPVPFTADAATIAFDRLIAESAPLAQGPRLDKEDVLLLQYTGGTTGLPKAAMLTHANLTAAVSIYEAWFSGQRASRPGQERVLCVLPLFHIYGLTAVFLRHIANGNEVLLRTRFDVEAVVRDIEEKKVTFFPGVPTMWIAFLNHPGIGTRDLSSLRVCSSGGAPLPVEIAEQFERLTGLPLRNGWGLTETSPAATTAPLDAKVPAGSCGLPQPGIVIDVVAADAPTRLLGPNQVGELRIKGPNVMKGYWNRPEETKAAFADGGFLTGDIGTMDENGFVFVVDRKKDMIISGGYNVYPRAIEDAIYEHPDVEEVIVIGVPDPYRGEAAKAFVKLKRGAAPLALETLRDFLADRLGRHEMPAALELRETLPKTGVGKLSKKELIAEERAKLALAEQRTSSSGRP
ncbi:MAG: dicarboxylate--CoA ligase PimA [Bradyrhizobiaceae bacterium]|nr:MAG: dicarboxylate--CoA ligase PimA [Bradyrhizobiaceae bacterium]